MSTTWRLKATRGHGWVQHLGPDGKPSITADPQGAKQWPTRDTAEAAAARMPADRVPVVAVEGPAFGRREHGAPS